MEQIVMEQIVVPQECVEHWRRENAHNFHLAFYLSAVLPRGKGVVPRILGSTYYRNVKHTLTLSSGALLAVVPRALDSYVGRLDINNCTVTRCCKHMLSPGNVLFDIGANVGLITLGLAKDFDDRITVCAFEPQSDLARSIAVSCRLSGLTHVTVYRTVVGEFNGETDFFRGRVSSLASRCPGMRPGKSERVQMVTLDVQVARGLLPTPDVVKIDVEGFTLQVLQGMEETIRRNHPALVFELGREDLTGHDPGQVMSFLGSLADYTDYRGFRLNADPRV